MVGLLALAHDRGCEADLAASLDAELAAGGVPDLAILCAHFAPDPESLPDIIVKLTPRNAGHKSRRLSTSPMAAQPRPSR
jgi:hypothetical protein